MFNSYQDIENYWNQKWNTGDYQAQLPGSFSYLANSNPNVILLNEELISIEIRNILNNSKLTHNKSLILYAQDRLKQNPNSFLKYHYCIFLHKFNEINLKELLKAGALFLKDVEKTTNSTNICLYVILRRLIIYLFKHNKNKVTKKWIKIFLQLPYNSHIIELIEDLLENNLIPDYLLSDTYNYYQPPVPDPMKPFFLETLYKKTTKNIDLKKDIGQSIVQFYQERINQTTFNSICKFNMGLLFFDKSIKICKQMNFNEKLEDLLQQRSEILQKTRDLNSHTHNSSTVITYGKNIKVPTPDLNILNTSSSFWKDLNIDNKHISIVHQNSLNLFSKSKSTMFYIDYDFLTVISENDSYNELNSFFKKKLVHRLLQSISSNLHNITYSSSNFLVNKSIDQYNSNNYIESCHISIPQIENTIRQILINKKINTISYSKTGKEINKMFGHSLDELENRLGANKTFVECCRYIFDSSGINLRNNIAHGKNNYFFSKKEFALITILTLISLERDFL